MRFTGSVRLGLALLAATPAMAQTGAAVRQPQDFECAVTVGKPCQGRIDFEVGRNFVFRIAGPGQAVVTNVSNRRCTLEYSALESTQASAGRSLNLGAGQSASLPVRDAGGMVVTFLYQGASSPRCEVQIAIQQ